MRQVIPTLKLFIGGEEHSDSWLRLVLDPNLPILDGCRWAIMHNDSESLCEAAELLGRPEALRRLRNTFLKLRTKDDSAPFVDPDRLHYLILGAIQSAEAARSYQEVGHPIAEPALLQAVARASVESNIGHSRKLTEALNSLSKCRLEGVVALSRWMCQWFQMCQWLHTKDEKTYVPLAFATTDSPCQGVLTNLRLARFSIPDMNAALVPDLESALTPYGTDLLDALARTWPDSMSHCVSWHIVRPPRATHLTGNSLQAAAAVALQLLRSNSERKIQRGVLVMASVVDGKLMSVGGEAPKLEAAFEVFKESRIDPIWEEDRLIVDRVIISAEAQIETARYPGLPIDSIHTLAEATEIAARRFDPGKQHDILSVNRRFTAIPPPDGPSWTVSTFPQSGVENRVVLGPDSRMDYECEVMFTRQNRCHQDYSLHYRADAPGSLFEATCYPESENKMQGPDWRTFKEHKRHFRFSFTPKLDKTYSLKASVYNGYGPGRRSVHCHLWPSARYEKAIFELDLSCYNAGRHPRLGLSADPERQPTLRLWREPGGEQKGHSYSQMCECEGWTDLPIAVKPAIEGAGTWQWVVNAVESGAIVWLSWEATVIEKQDNNITADM